MSRLGRNHRASCSLEFRQRDDARLARQVAHYNTTDRADLDKQCLLAFEHRPPPTSEVSSPSDMPRPTTPPATGESPGSPLNRLLIVVPPARRLQWRFRYRAVAPIERPETLARSTRSSTRTSPAGSAPVEVRGQFVGAPLGLRARVGRFGQAEVSGSATWTFASRHEDVSPPAVARMCPSALCSPGSRAHTACGSTVIVNQAAGSRG